MKTIARLANSFFLIRLLCCAAVVLVELSASRAGAATIVHPGDTLAINVLNYNSVIDDSTGHFKNLESNSLIVTADGSISMPIAGSVRVAGKSTTQIAASIRGRLSRFVRDPAVTVQLLQQSQQLFLTGATVGTLAFLPGETLSTALGQLREQFEKDHTTTQNPDDKNAGTLTHSEIDLRRVVLERDGADGAAIDGEALLRSGRPGPILQPDDTLHFAAKPIRIDIRGQVAEPGSIYLYKEDTLEQALLEAGGPLGGASTVDATLVRSGTESTIALASAAMRQNPEDGDVLIVHAAPRVTVLGQVATPGEFGLKNGSTLLIALYSSGGPTRWANVKDIEVIHGASKKTYDLSNLQHGDLTSDVALVDGDVVYVPEGHKIDSRLFFSGLLSAIGASYDLTHY